MSTPQVDGITIQLGNGKELRIETNGKNPILDKNYYISKVTLNGKEYQGSWLPLEAIKDGGLLQYELSERPTKWAQEESLTPPSGPEADYTKSTAAAGSSLLLNK